MHFGLQSAPACFQLLMDRLIGVLDASMAAYIDDLIIMVNNLLHFHNVLEGLKAAGFMVKRDLGKQSTLTHCTVHKLRALGVVHS